MTPKKYLNIGISVIALCVVIFLTAKYCKSSKTYTQKEVDQIVAAVSDSSRLVYEQQSNTINGKLEESQKQIELRDEHIHLLEDTISALLQKHQATKTKVVLGDTGTTIVPNEYIHECEGCFDLLGRYKKESNQLRFERDSYDSLMRQQNSISENRIAELEQQKLTFNKLLNDCRLARAGAPVYEPTRKVKLSAMAMFGSPFTPKGGGIGVIYEDKKFNEYGGHYLLTDNKPIYLFHIAKTISLRRKK